MHIIKFLILIIQIVSTTTLTKRTYKISNYLPGNSQRQGTMAKKKKNIISKDQKKLNSRKKVSRKAKSNSTKKVNQDKECELNINEELKINQNIHDIEMQKLDVYYNVLKYVHMIINNMSKLKILNLKNDLSFNIKNDLNYIADRNGEILNIVGSINKPLLHLGFDVIPRNIVSISDRIYNFIFKQSNISYIDNPSFFTADLSLHDIILTSNYTDLVVLYFHCLKNTSFKSKELKDISIYLLLFLDSSKLDFKIRPYGAFKNLLALKMILSLRTFRFKTFDVNKIILNFLDELKTKIDLFVNVFSCDSILHNGIQKDIQKKLKCRTYLGPIRILDHFHIYCILKPSNMFLNQYFSILENDEFDSLHALQNDLFRSFGYLFDVFDR